MKYTDEQIENILTVYPSVEEMERQKELQRLTEWFKYYDEKNSQYARETRYGESSVPIEELDKQAEINKIRLRELRNID